ncbi:MAG: hypothetical protein IJH12_06710 [Clostridia bacterium]|nr:hypothetical protein [Clostridia bacterium]
MEDIDVIIRVTCQELYDNLRKNHSIFSDFKSQMCIDKLNKINADNEYRCTEVIRDEIGILYKNYMVFCRKNDYDENINIIKKIYGLYVSLCIQQEQCLIGSGEYNKYSEYKNIEEYIKKLESTYGGQTEKYLKKISMKNLGPQRQLLKDLCKDKSKIISEKKKIAVEILEDKLNNWNNRFKNEKSLKIIYNSENAEYILGKIEHGKYVSKKKIKFKTNFDDIEVLQNNALKKLRQLNFGIDVRSELKLNKTNTKYIDPFILMSLCQENYLDYAKIYLRAVSGNSNYKKAQLPFVIKYNINVDYKKGKMTPVRNEIMAIIAERSSLTVAHIKNYKCTEKSKIKRVG